MTQDIIANSLCKIMNAKRARKQEVYFSYYSKFLIQILEIAKKHGYIKEFSLDEKQKQLKVEIQKLNKCNAIKPRYTIGHTEIDKYIKRYLPARNVGIILISTSKGLMTQEEALEKNLGGSLIAYFY